MIALRIVVVIGLALLAFVPIVDGIHDEIRSVEWPGRFVFLAMTLGVAWLIFPLNTWRQRAPSWFLWGQVGFALAVLVYSLVSHYAPKGHGSAEYRFLQEQFPHLVEKEMSLDLINTLIFCAVGILVFGILVVVRRAQPDDHTSEKSSDPL
jgi:hypothetical protein